MLQLDEVTIVNGAKEMIVKLQKRDNTVVNAWTTRIIKENLLNVVEKNMYIMSRGKKIPKKSKKLLR